MFCSRIWFFLLLPGWTCRTWTILWTEGLLSKSGHGMATPALMEVDNDDNVVDIINFVAMYYEKGTSGNAFRPKEKFRAPASRQVKILKVIKEKVRWVDLSLRERGLSQERSEFQWPQYPCIYSTLEYGLCAPRYNRQRVATLDGEANFLLGRVSAFGRAIRYNNRFMFSWKRPFSQSLQPLCLNTFSYTPHNQLAELASSPDGN